MNTEPSGRPSVLVFGGDADEAADVADAVESMVAASVSGGDDAHTPGDDAHTPGDDASSTPNDGDLAAAEAAVVLDADGLDAVHRLDRSYRVVAFVDDPVSEPATDPLVDAIATTPTELDATLRWLAAGGGPGLDRDDEALRAERDHLLALFSNVPDPAIAYDYVDGEPIVHRVNDAFEETFGYAADRVVGESVDDFIVPPTEEAESEATELNERLQRGENVRREVTRETADGPRHFILHVVPIRLDAENVSGYAIYTDVTERREREAALERQNERLDEFASIVSHDLRNPLSVAEGYVALANETGETAHLEKTVEALDRMDELVGDLLSLARQGESVGDTEPVSIEALARDAWESVDTGGAELVVDGDVTVDASATRTRELLENVFRNSVEHGRLSPETDDAGHVTVRVGTAAFRSDDGAAGSGFFVEDDGCGLPEGQRDRVFESGFTTEEDGTGLGLAITKRIADAHGWEVRALAGDSGGARFEFKTS
ncbi:PAS domain-containing sensor histidine kinase [Halorubrum lipolyticum]|uniref:histidine kinase n=1 Tax=Halorubrum lipolyticum DSM 21995 TaxID=1227482 RepID=M0NXG3_9EURY|nr:PAS domain-containing sensor histidine kinase [Halorubrum lipolyticum]EMA62491.1 PAS/PAC sensor signal transduction histidine kinase [Halorubrum lipolyticum DSM 21995]